MRNVALSQGQVKHQGRTIRRGCDPARGGDNLRRKSGRRYGHVVGTATSRLRQRWPRAREARSGEVDVKDVQGQWNDLQAGNSRVHCVEDRRRDAKRKRRNHREQLRKALVVGDTKDSNTNIAAAGYGRLPHGLSGEQRELWNAGGTTCENSSRYLREAHPAPSTSALRLLS